jgi:hypothetical protein
MEDANYASTRKPLVCSKRLNAGRNKCESHRTASVVTHIDAQEAQFNVAFPQRHALCKE